MVRFSTGIVQTSARTSMSPRKIAISDSPTEAMT
jgi:hypothetical protein